MTKTIKNITPDLLNQKAIEALSDFVNAPKGFTFGKQLDSKLWYLNLQ